MLIIHDYLWKPAQDKFCYQGSSKLLYRFYKVKGELSEVLHYSINISSRKLDRLFRTFGCQLGSFPFTYLGIPLVTSKPRIADFLTLV
jgi:hypothetical protein